MKGTGRVVLVTGASSGIGRAVAVAFLKNGDRVVLAARRGEALEETVALSETPADNALCVPTDIRDPKAVAALFAAAKEQFGRLDVLFNNAGTGARGVPMEELSVEEWETVVATNLTGPFLCTQEAIRIMKAQSPKGGRIINNGSISAYSPRPNTTPYTATKHAITGLTKSTALDCRVHDIACGQIDIGNAATPLASAMAKGVPQADGRIVAEPVMDVEHVANAVLHMASLPPDVNVLFMTVMATKMPFVGRG